MKFLDVGLRFFSVKYRIKNGKHCLYIRSHDVKFSKVAYDNHVGISKLKYQYKKFELAITLAKSNIIIIIIIIE